MQIETNLRIVWPQGEDSETSEFFHKLDMIFVHGLNPAGNEKHGIKTWTTGSGTLWPKDLLPSRVKHARIMMFEYNSNVAFDASETDLRGHAASLLDSVQGVREETNSLSHPIVFVGHSLGGLLIKQALVLAKQNDRVYGELLRSTEGIVFFATPHRGGNGATLGEVAAKAVSFISGSGRNDLVKSLKKKSKTLAQLSADFAHQHEDYQFLSVIESKPLLRALMNPIRTVVVDRDSAILGLPGHRERVLEMDRDHRQICKFEEGPGFTLVARQLNRIAEHAIRSLESKHGWENSGPLPTITAPLPSTEAETRTPLIGLYSTLDQSSEWPIIGQKDLLQWLGLFIKQPNETCLLLHGPAGTGKSIATYDVASRWSKALSVFWFCAESPRSIERGFQNIKRLANAGKPSHRPQQKRPFKEWLSKEHHGPWIAIFDNAYPGFDLRGLLPRAGGKIIVTARHTDIWIDSGFARKEMPPLRRDDAIELFVSRCYGQQQAVGSRQCVPTPTATVIQRLIDRPLAIAFAATCVSSMNLASANDHLQILDNETAHDITNLDPKIWKWGCHVLEELNSRESYLLSLICVFDADWISDNFLDLLANEVSPNNMFNNRRYTGLLNRLLKLHLVQRRRNAIRQYYCVPLAIKECVIQYVIATGEHGSIRGIIEEGCELIHSALTATSLKSGNGYRESLEIAYPHIQSLCLAAMSHSVPLSDGFLPHFPGICQFALKEATQDAERFCHKQFWRIWLLNNNFPLNEANKGEDDGAELIVHPAFPSWLVERATAESEIHENLRNFICDSIVSSFLEDVKTSEILAAVGQCWHGVREEVFEFIRTHEHAPRNESQLGSIINSVDSGACAGLQNAVAIHVRSEDYNSETREDGAKSLKDLIDIVTVVIANSGIVFSDFSSETLTAAKTVVSNSWEVLKTSSFFQMCGAFEDVFKGSVVGALCSVTVPGLTSYVEPDSFKNTTGFIMQTLAADPVKARIALASRGYWDVMGALTLFFAADILRELSSVVRNAGSDADKSKAASEALMTGAIDMARAAIMSFGNEVSPGWKLVLTKATFWCVQAEECRKAWGAGPDVDRYYDQDRWEEYRILSGSSNNWPISDVI